MHARRALVAALLLPALGGCGGGGVTKQDLIARGDAICTNALRAVRAVPPSTAQFDRVAAIVSREAGQLRALPRPDTDRTLLERYLTAAGTLAVQYRSLARAERANDHAAVAAALAALKANPAPRLAARYGFRACAGGGATVGSG